MHDTAHGLQSANTVYKAYHPSSRTIFPRQWFEIEHIACVSRMQA